MQIISCTETKDKGPSYAYAKRLASYVAQNNLQRPITLTRSAYVQHKLYIFRVTLGVDPILDRIYIIERQSAVFATTPQVEESYYDLVDGDNQTYQLANFGSKWLAEKDSALQDFGNLSWTGVYPSYRGSPLSYRGPLNGLVESDFFTITTGIVGDHPISAGAISEEDLVGIYTLNADQIYYKGVRVLNGLPTFDGSRTDCIHAICRVDNWTILAVVNYDAAPYLLRIYATDFPVLHDIYDTQVGFTHSDTPVWYVLETGYFFDTIPKQSSWFSADTTTLYMENRVFTLALAYGEFTLAEDTTNAPMTTSGTKVLSYAGAAADYWSDGSSDISGIEYLKNNLPFGAEPLGVTASSASFSTSTSRAAADAATPDTRPLSGVNAAGGLMFFGDVLYQERFPENLYAAWAAHVVLSKTEIIKTPVVYSGGAPRAVVLQAVGRVLAKGKTTVALKIPAIAKFKMTAKSQVRIVRPSNLKLRCTSRTAVNISVRGVAKLKFCGSTVMTIARTQKITGACIKFYGRVSESIKIVPRGRIKAIGICDYEYKPPAIRVPEITFSNLVKQYDGTDLHPDITVVPDNLQIEWDTTCIDVGVYSVTVVAFGDGWYGEAETAFTVTPVILNTSVEITYSGSPVPFSFTTLPPVLTIEYTFDGVPYVSPTNVKRAENGSVEAFSVVGHVAHNKYTEDVSGSLTINPVNPEFSISAPAVLTFNDNLRTAIALEPRLMVDGKTLLPGTYVWTGDFGTYSSSDATPPSYNYTTVGPKTINIEHTATNPNYVYVTTTQKVINVGLLPTTLTIGSFSLTVDVYTDIQIVSNSPASISVSIAGVAEGYVSMEQFSNSTPGLCTFRLLGAACGTVAINASQGVSGVHASTFSNLSAVVGKGSLETTIVAPASVTYGTHLLSVLSTEMVRANGAPLTPTAVSYFVFGVQLTSANDLFSVASSPITVTAVVTLSGVSANNYFTPQDVDGSSTDEVVITKADIVVHSSTLPTSMTYGQDLTGAVSFLPAGGGVAYDPPLNTFHTYNATIDSGIPVSLTVSYTNPDSANYNNFAGAEYPIVINKKLVNITADPVAMVYGTHPLIALFPVTTSGFIGGDSLLIPYVSGSPVIYADTSADVGTHPIQIDVSGLSSTNYTFASVNGVLTITKAAQPSVYVYATNLKVGQTTQAYIAGGAGTGAVVFFLFDGYTYASVSAAGLVTGLAIGSYAVGAYKLGDNNYDMSLYNANHGISDYYRITTNITYSPIAVSFGNGGGFGNAKVTISGGSGGYTIAKNGTINGLGITTGANYIQISSYTYPYCYSNGGYYVITDNAGAVAPHILNFADWFSKVLVSPSIQVCGGGGGGGGGGVGTDISGLWVSTVTNMSLWIPDGSHSGSTAIITIGGYAEACAYDFTDANPFSLVTIFYFDGEQYEEIWDLTVDSGNGTGIAFPSGNNDFGVLVRSST